MAIASGPAVPNATRAGKRSHFSPENPIKMRVSQPVIKADVVFYFCEHHEDTTKWAIYPSCSNSVTAIASF